MAKGWRSRVHYNLNPFIGLSMHDTMVIVPLPPFIIPADLPHIDFSVVQGLWLGSFLSVGHGKKIVSDHLLLVGRTSDAGLVVPHISIPPSPFNILTTLFGMSMIVFGSSAVTIGCKNLIWGNQDCDTAATPFGPVPLSINLGCFDPVCLPTDLDVLWGTTYVSMTWGDIIAGIVSIALSMIADVAARGLGSLVKKAGKSLLSKLGREVVEVGAEDAAKSTFKKGLREAADEEACAAYKDYMLKAAKVQGLKDSLDMTDEDLAKFAKESGTTFSKELPDVAAHLDEGLANFGKKYAEVDVAKAAQEGADEFAQHAKQLEELGVGVTDKEIAGAAKQTMLRDAMKELDAAVTVARDSEANWAAGLWLASSTASSTLLTHLLFYGNALGSGTQGGLLSFKGAGLTNFFEYTRTSGSAQWASWLDLSKLGLSGSHATDWGAIYDKVAGGVTGVADTVADHVDDYWYATVDGVSDGFSATQDYWYGMVSPTQG